MFPKKLTFFAACFLAIVVLVLIRTTRNRDAIDSRARVLNSAPQSSSGIAQATATGLPGTGQGDAGDKCALDIRVLNELDLPLSGVRLRVFCRDSVIAEGSTSDEGMVALEIKDADRGEELIVYGGKNNQGSRLYWSRWVLAPSDGEAQVPHHRQHTVEFSPGSRIEICLRDGSGLPAPDIALRLNFLIGSHDPVLVGTFHSVIGPVRDLRVKSDETGTCRLEWISPDLVLTFECETSGKWCDDVRTNMVRPYRLSKAHKATPEGDYFAEITIRNSPVFHAVALSPAGEPAPETLVCLYVAALPHLVEHDCFLKNRTGADGRAKLRSITHPQNLKTLRGRPYLLAAWNPKYGMRLDEGHLEGGDENFTCRFSETDRSAGRLSGRIVDQQTGAPVPAFPLVVTSYAFPSEILATFETSESGVFQSYGFPGTLSPAWERRYPGGLGFTVLQDTKRSSVILDMDSALDKGVLVRPDVPAEIELVRRPGWSETR